ncbi:hypothetical protein FRB99_008193 [Tulasnella sp. 403]|nr:hypothetical protein FRB99_008193 [Tulasnella sp. 403]
MRSIIIAISIVATTFAFAVPVEQSSSGTRAWASRSVAGPRTPNDLGKRGTPNYSYLNNAEIAVDDAWEVMGGGNNQFLARPAADNMVYRYMQILQFFQDLMPPDQQPDGDINVYLKGLISRARNRDTYMSVPIQEWEQLGHATQALEKAMQYDIYSWAQVINGSTSRHLFRLTELFSATSQIPFLPDNDKRREPWDKLVEDLSRIITNHHIPGYNPKALNFRKMLLIGKYKNFVMLKPDELDTLKKDVQDLKASWDKV